MTEQAKSKFSFPNIEDYRGRLFLIHAMPRTASTSFRVWINRQPDAICHGEILGPKNVLGTSHKQKNIFKLKQRNLNPHSFLKTYFVDHDEQMVGFKALSSHLLDQRNLPFLRYFFKGEPKVLMLYRSDLVTRFKSTVYHRFRDGKISEAAILKLGVRDIVSNCIQTEIQWDMANQYWMSGLQCHYLNIKDIGTDMRPDLEKLLGLKMDGDLPHTNAQASLQAKDNLQVKTHLDEICSATILDQFRNMEFEP